MHHQQLLPRVQAGASEEFARRGAVKPNHLGKRPAHRATRPDVERIAAGLLGCHAISLTGWPAK
jgi:hypothetical protein